MYMGVCTNHQKAIKYCATNVVLTLALIQIIKTRLVFRIILYEHTNVYNYQDCQQDKCHSARLGSLAEMYKFRQFI